MQAFLSVSLGRNISIAESHWKQKQSRKPHAAETAGLWDPLEQQFLLEALWSSQSQAMVEMGSQTLPQTFLVLLNRQNGNSQALSPQHVTDLSQELQGNMII